MDVMVVGSGGREHAICAAFRRSPRVKRLICAPGNPGIARFAECAPISPEGIGSLADFAAGNKVDLTFVGGEAALALGIVDEFESRGLKIVGPRRLAARLEASKAFSKDFMQRHGIPTARYEIFEDVREAVGRLRSGGFGAPNVPVVIKADGLAAGKGVVVAADREAAIGAVESLQDLAGSAAAKKIIIEECLIGHEISLLMFASGEHFSLMPATRDHKRIGEGDTGPNTGGMGTITDGLLLAASDQKTVIDQIIVPTLRGCAAEGMPFHGVLFLGLMMTADGPRLLEYNVRFGDPETQAILVRLESDFVDICEAIVSGTIGEQDVRWTSGSSACVVMATEGYPSKPVTGDIIRGLEAAEALARVSVFQAGTAYSPENGLITNGGRVFGVTAVGEDLAEALDSAYEAVDRISFRGMQFRRDIGASVVLR
jgi:phosphoribosylamine--glycine ligase